MNPTVGVFDRYADDYDQWFDENNEVYAAQADCLSRYITGTDNSLEIGVGSGRFASRLGIRHGLDPSARLLAMAHQRGVETVRGRGGIPAVPGRNIRLCPDDDSHLFHG